MNIRRLTRRMPRTMQHARENGWILVRGRRHTIMVHEPTGRQVAFPATPSDYRADLNARAQLRRIEREESAR